MFGIERALASLARAAATTDCHRFTERLLGDVDRFARRSDQTDDITILALSWNHPRINEDGSVLDLTMKPTVDGLRRA